MEKRELEKKFKRIFVSARHSAFFGLFMLVVLFSGCGGSEKSSVPVMPAAQKSGEGEVSIQLSWEQSGAVKYAAPSGVTTVEISVSASDMTTITKQFSATPGSAGSGTVSGIPAGTGRTFSASGLNSSGTCLYNGSKSGVTITAGGSASVSITLSNPCSTPSAPAGLTAMAGNGEVTLTWTASALAESYNLYMASESGVTSTNYATLQNGMKHTGVESPYTHTGLTNGITYYFVVTAVNGVGESGASSVVSATPTGTTGTLQGYVKEAVVTGSPLPLEGASVAIYDSSSNLVASATTDASGVYSKQLTTGTYSLILSKTGYITENVYGVVIESGVTKTIETVLQVSNQYAGKGTIAGTIKSAVSGAGIAIASIKFRKGINVTSGTVVATATTDSSGAYSVSDLDAGNYTGEVSATGYTTAYFTAVCLGGQTKSGQDATMTPVIASGQTRIVLTWGETPSDLDSHLTGPCPTDEGTSYCQDGRFHLYYPLADENSGSYWPSYERLDLDNTTHGTSYYSDNGPETTTIYQQIDGMYRFSVHDYSNLYSSSSSELSSSGAQIKVYRGDTLVATYNVPVNQGGTLWTVFEMNGNTITPINTMSYNSSYGDTVQRQKQLFQTDSELLLNLPEK